MDTPHAFAPSIGLAWQVPASEGILGWLFGKNPGDAVLRAGYALATIRDAGQFMTYGDTNAGLTFSTTVSPSNAYASTFGAPGSVQFSQANLPVYAGPSSPQYPISPTVSNTLYTYDPKLQIPYVQSWNVGFQRRLSKNTAVEIRYTGNHGVKLWRVINENENNTFENGFQTQFYNAQENLFLNRGCTGSPSNPLAWNTCTTPASTSFANNGLPGQSSNIGIITTASGLTSDTTTATALRQNNVGSLANTYQTNTTDNGRLLAAGYRPNLFVVNPNVAGADIIENGGFSTFNSLQIELNRRLSAGFLLQGSYVFSKNLGEGGQPTTLRNWGLDKGPVNTDIRNAIKINAIYQLPVGKGKPFVNSVPVLSKILEGWEIAGISRIQSGGAFQLTSGTGSSERYGMDNQASGVVLENMTLPQLQNMVNIQKLTPAQTSSTSVTPGIVQWLPTSLINNTNAAWELNGQSWANLNTSAPYVSPQLAPGQYGYEVNLRQPWQYHFDVSVIKRVRIKEKVNLEITGNFDNILNYTNFLLANGPTSTSFGRTTSAYNDLSYNYDPGSRVIELKGRISF
jgi:hypothetical protein